MSWHLSLRLGAATAAVAAIALLAGATSASAATSDTTTGPIGTMTSPPTAYAQGMDPVRVGQFQLLAAEGITANMATWSASVTEGAAFTDVVDGTHAVGEHFDWYAGAGAYHGDCVYTDARHLSCQNTLKDPAALIYIGHWARYLSITPIVEGDHTETVTFAVERYGLDGTWMDGLEGVSGSADVVWTQAAAPSDDPTPSGDTPGDETPGETPADGQTPSDDTPAGDIPSGDGSSHDTPSGDVPGDDPSDASAAAAASASDDATATGGDGGLATAEAASAPSSLATTGSGLVPVALGGLGLVLAGVGGLSLRRRLTRG